MPVGLDPFWLETLELSRPRDSFTTKRRVLALAALAYLAAHECQDAEEALARCAHHAHADIRAQAVIYWGAFYRALQQALPQSVAEAMLTIALNDAAFGPRFQARQILRENNLPVPLDNPPGVYACKVKFKWAKSIYRIIELRSDQTLEDLHLAIQHAIRWDNDHLYSFYLNGVKHDERYRYSCPYEEDRPPWTEEAVIGQLGLVKRHKFLYYFDYGDGHEFEIEVTDIRPQAERGEYPRVVESQGAAPEQYDRGEW
jgi:hypothetical protein